MLLFLLTTLTTLTLHTTLVYSDSSDSYRSLTPDAREVVDEVLSSLTRPQKQLPAETSDLDVFLRLFARPRNRLAQDVRELRNLLSLLSNKAADHEAKLTEILESVESRRPAAQTSPDEWIATPETEAKDGRDIESRPINVQTRSCKFRLGGHCRTSIMDKAVKQYHYLLSPDSPGRKRRSLREVLTNQRLSEQ